ncbi:MAG: hypothetical protein ACO3PR_13750, partial [Limisphaerales bacterium]
MSSNSILFRAMAMFFDFSWDVGLKSFTTLYDDPASITCSPTPTCHTRGWVFPFEPSMITLRRKMDDGEGNVYIV